MKKMGNIPLFIPKDIDKYFYNRNKDLNKINFYLSGLHEEISQQLSITGYRGVGKTFLLHKIIKDINPNFLVTYIDNILNFMAYIILYFVDLFYI